MFLGRRLKRYNWNYFWEIQILFRYKKTKARNQLKLRALYVNGAEGENRTRTTEGHCPLKTACLPVPPLRHYYLLYWAGFCSSAGWTACSAVFIVSCSAGTISSASF